MVKLKSFYMALAFVFLLLPCSWGCFDARAQFKENAFSQQYNDDPAKQKDSTDVLFSFKEYFGGLKHKNELKIGNMFAGSAVFIGGCQIYNKQYWKLPIVYGAIGGSLGAGIYLNSTGNHNAARWCFVGAGVAWWGSLMDGVINYGPKKYPHAGTATLYSLLVPGLGQIYNKEYGKFLSILDLWALASTITSIATRILSASAPSIRRRLNPDTAARSAQTRPYITATPTDDTGIMPCWPRRPFIFFR